MSTTKTAPHIVFIMTDKQRFDTIAAAVPPNETPLAPARPVPVIVTFVPPAIGPLFGETAVTAGAGGAR